VRELTCHLLAVTDHPRVCVQGTGDDPIEQSLMQNSNISCPSNAFEYVPESTPDLDEDSELREHA
jgi:hypothetical protein